MTTATKDTAFRKMLAALRLSERIIGDIKTGPNDARALCESHTVICLAIEQAEEVIRRELRR